MNKIDITYIGNKEVKKDTITNSRLVFPRLKSVPVEPDIAHQLLIYPEVWVLSKDAEALIEKKAAKEAAIAKKIEEEKAEAEKQNLEDSMLVSVNDEVLDIAKYSGAQLATLVEANDLTITVKAKPVAAFREAIRDELSKLNGTPAVEA